MTALPRLLILLLLTATAAFCSAPDKLDGLIYYQYASTITHSAYSFAYVLSADGTFTTLHFRSSPAPGYPFTLNQPVDGTFIYRKLDDTTAELTFSSPTAAGSPALGKRTLTFTSDTEGQGSDGIDLPSTFRLAPLAPTASLLVNCSNRSFLNPGKAAFTGFVVTGGSPATQRTVLVRAVGPGLGIFGITDFLRNPTLSVIRASDNAVVGVNDDWSSESATAISRTSAVVGAFPLAAGSKDAVAIMSLRTGAYVAQVTSPDAADTGQTLIEVYILP